MALTVGSHPPPGRSSRRSQVGCRFRYAARGRIASRTVGCARPIIHTHIPRVSGAGWATTPTRRATPSRLHDRPGDGPRVVQDVVPVAEFTEVLDLACAALGVRHPVRELEAETMLAPLDFTHAAGTSTHGALDLGGNVATTGPQARMRHAARGARR